MRRTIVVWAIVLGAGIATASPQSTVPCGTFVGSWTKPGATSREAFAPYGVAVDRHGDVYVTDYATSRIEKFQRDGTFLPAWGMQGSANAGFHLARGIA